MHHSTCLIPIIVGVLSTSVCAQSSISVVGRVVDENHAPLRVEVTLGISMKADPRDRIVSDQSNSYGLFQLAKSTVGNFSELYLWIEEPYSYAPKPVAAVKTDMWRKKMDEIVLQRTLIGSIPPEEAIERIAAIYSIEHLKSKIGIQDTNVSTNTAKKLATNVLARCESIQEQGKLDSIISNVAKLVPPENAIFSESQPSLLALAKQDNFILLAQAEKNKQDDISKVISSYLQGKQEYSGKFVGYVNGLNAATIKPEWFVDREASARVWVNLQPNSGKRYENSFVVGSMKPEMLDGQLVGLKPTRLNVDINQPPKAEDVEKWFQSHPNNSKILLKAIILADPKLTAARKKDIDKNIMAPSAIVIPKGRG
ncbi:MAG: hypothetical protein ABIK07_02320 [Planctomycetota bacterium]